MNIFERSADWVGKRLLALGNREKFVDYPTVAGGPDILRNFITTGESSWSDSKRLATYKKSLYVFACVSKIGQKTASIDWELYRIVNQKGDKEQIFVHEALDLLYRPNPFQTKEEFFQRFIINKKLTGSAFILKVRNAKGKVVELWNLRPDYMRILFDNELIIKGYEFTAAGKSTIFAPGDIVYDSYPDPTVDFGGMSALQPAQIRVEIEEFASKYQRNFFVNNARPDFVLMTDKKLSAEQKTEMKASWDKRHKSNNSQENVGKGAFLEGGMTYQQVSVSQREMDLIESSKFTRDDILVALAVPKPVIAITDDVNLANAETGMRIFLSETIVPEIKALTTKLNEHLIYEEYGEIYFIQYEDPVPENRIEKADTQTKRLAAGTMLINEAREEWGDEPVRGGDTLYLPFGLQAVGGKPTATIQDVAEKAARRHAKSANVFRGRPKAMIMLKKKEEILGKIYSTLKEQIEQEPVPVQPIERAFVPSEQKVLYADFVNKAIDERGKSLEEALNVYVEKEQKPRLLQAIKLNAKLSHGKIVDDVTAALAKWAKKEAKLTTEFVFPFIAEYVKLAGDQAMALVAPGETFSDKTERITKYINDRALLFGTETTKTTLEKVASRLAQGIASDVGINELADLVNEVFDQFGNSRSLMIARTEATSANNLGFTEAYKQSGVANAKEWIATGDERTRDSHIAVDGDIVKLDASFKNGLQYPGDGSADPGETVNCRCVLGPAFQE